MNGWFFASDLNASDSISYWALFDGTGGQGSGHFVAPAGGFLQNQSGQLASFGGGEIPAGVVAVLPTSVANQTSFVGGATAGTKDALYALAYDGHQWSSSWQQFQVTTV
jgi:hypothetical protein